MLRKSFSIHYIQSTDNDLVKRIRRHQPGPGSCKIYHNVSRQEDYKEDQKYREISKWHVNCTAIPYHKVYRMRAQLRYLLLQTKVGMQSIYHQYLIDRGNVQETVKSQHHHLNTVRAYSDQIITQLSNLMPASKNGFQ